MVDINLGSVLEVNAYRVSCRYLLGTAVSCLTLEIGLAGSWSQGLLWRVFFFFFFFSCVKDPTQLAPCTLSLAGMGQLETLKAERPYQDI